MEKIFEKLQNNKAVNRFLNKDGRFVVQDALSLSLLISSSFYKQPQKYCIVCENLYNAQQVYEQLVNLIGEENTLFFPQDEVIKIDVEAHSKEMLGQRLYVLEKALEDKPRVLICHIASLTRYLPNIQLFKDNTLTFKVGEHHDIKGIVSSLMKQGFTKVSKIDSSLQFSHRGDIIDIFPINYDTPLRIDFFDDEIESIRLFNVADQLSYDSINEAIIYPANDLLLEEGFCIKTKDVLTKKLEESKEGLKLDIYKELERRINEDIYSLMENGMNENYYKYYSFFIDGVVNIIDYFNPDLTVVYKMEECLKAASFLEEQTYYYYREVYKIGHALKSYSFFDDFISSLNHASNIIQIHSRYENNDDVEMGIRSVPEVASNVSKSIENILRYIDEKKKVIICLNKQQLLAYEEYLKNYEMQYERIEINQLPKGNIGLCESNIAEGFELIDEGIIYLSGREIFGYKQHISKFIHRYKQAKTLKSYNELEKGDYVVHEECGIGQFEEISTLEVEGIHKDFLKIKYAGTGVLFVPLEQFKLVRKYVSKEGAAPKLSTIGGTDWARTKMRIKNRVNDLADRLIALYAERTSLPGYACKKDDEFQDAFEKAFPFALTEDQIKAVNEIKSDMESPHPMDRLLCGDVGFGKTEVAFRAAFKAILSGGQVALLCPTTLLARQHYERALERFSLFGVKIAMFSRFVPDAIQKAQIKEIIEGQTHLIIGTHRLLSKDISIPNLRLLIIDEEQRFGVEHKEKIKEMSKNIDVLTLTATPIPRTLQMSLLGIRSLSQLQSAPLNRMPIQTYVIPYNETTVKEAIERELARKGQIFYLHNDTSTMSKKAESLRKLIKGSRVDIVNGKMDKDDIEEIMVRFYNGEIDILVCTSIIETGLDISNVNTIIVEDAYKFGLAQLYQIKGRVGRSNRIAYAYLMFDENKELTDIAKKRLKALKDFTELGSGYKIAQRDLSIRGAGDILGPEQAGFIDTVGIDMYVKLLNEVIEEKMGKKEEKKEIKVTNVSMDGYIPIEYASSDGDKLEMYQEIQKISSIPELDVYKKKMRDIYGQLPQSVEMLFRKRKIDILSSSPYIDSMKEEMGSIVIILTKETSMIRKIGITLFEKMGHLADHIKGSFVNKQIKLRLMKNKDFLEELEMLLKIISEISA